MKVYKGIDAYEKVANAVVTTGTFDGVHKGHRSILNRLIETAKKEQGISVLLTFFPHPRMVLQPENDLKLINTIEEKIDLLEEAGLDVLIIQPFTKAFSRTSSLEFVRDILVNTLGTKKLVIGYDHHFGRNREGSFEHLKEFGPIYGFEVEEIPAQDIEEVNISSTKIRTALEEGNVELANSYLGSQFSLSGEVVHGKKLGRTLGFPTANLWVSESYKLIPATGIYAVYVHFNGQIHKGMLNIGYRPTINERIKDLSIEVHLFDFDEDLYEKEIRIQLVKRIRDEKQFDDLDALKSELAKDQNKAIHFLS